MKGKELVMKIRIFSVLWCPSCIIMRPRYDEIKLLNKEVEFEEFDFDEDKEYFDKYKIGDTLPVFILFDDEEKETVRLIGEYSKKNFRKKLGEYLNV